MSPIVIANPILNSPFEEPTRHFRFTDDGITDEIVDERRLAGYFVPVPQPKKKGKQLALDTEWTLDRFKEAQFINRVRARVKVWRQQGWPGTTNTTAALLRHWSSSGRERRLFFCHLEAVETAIYLTEIAPKQGDAWIENSLRDANQAANPGLYRTAFKMATGSGKTVVMGMLIAWQALNKLANTQDARFSDAFLIVTPGITIRDRLRVLLPSDPETYYRQLDLAPPDLLPRLGEAKIVVTNFHAFLLRETLDASKLTKQVVTRGRPSALSETPDQMVRRVCRELGSKRGIVVLNDEAHHCYRNNPTPASRDEDAAAPAEKLSADEKREAKQRDADARVWISGIEAISKKLGIRALFDLSHTVLPARFGLPRRNDLPVGGLGLFVDRRDRSRHRQGAARPRRG
jgi:type III restriction enzyme